MRFDLTRRAGALVALLVSLCLAVDSSLAGTLRVVTWNIEADINGATTPLPGFDTVLHAIGSESVNGIARPLDILALQETTNNTTTVTPIVNDLNTFYGSSVAYAMSTFQATSNGGVASGGGPNALVYNSKTVTLVQSFGLGLPGGTPREPVRYLFQPVGGAASQQFYVYVSHYKAGTTSTDLSKRLDEANAIRADALNLPASARILYVGDFNVSSSTETSYAALIAPGQGQGFDPINMPGDWATNSAFKGILTESADNLRYRDDFQLVTQNVLTDSSALRYIAGSYHAFGNNGTTAVFGTVDSGSNTALPGLANRAAVLTALTTASDHLPVVADYNVIVPEPASLTLCVAAASLLILRRRHL